VIANGRRNLSERFSSADAEQLIEGYRRLIKLTEAQLVPVAQRTSLRIATPKEFFRQLAKIFLS